MQVLRDVQKRAHTNLSAIDSSSAAPLDKVAASSPLVSDLSAAADQIGSLTLNLTNDQVALVADEGHRVVPVHLTCASATR